MPPPSESPSRQEMRTGVLRSVATITGQRDRDLMALSLVNTLGELIDSERISMYRVYPSDADVQMVLVSEVGRQGAATAPAGDAVMSIADRPAFEAAFRNGIEQVESATGGRNHAIYPVIGQHGVSALLETVSARHSEADRHLIQAFLKVYSNYLTLLDESETDTLTGLLNRRTFDNNIEKIVAECSPPDNARDVTDETPARRAGYAEFPHWLAVIDIDHFKRVNDKFGHLYGDEVLILLARQMRQVFRQTDKLFRFGGEEFVVVLDRTPLQKARQVLERFRNAVEHYHFPQLGQITISIGFVRLDRNDVPSSIIGRADQALYYAKHHGRNRVCFYEDLLATGKLAGAYYSDDIQMF